MYFVSILVCRQTGRTYVGQTDHLIRRFRLHQAGLTKTTRDKLREPFLLHWESFPTRAVAMRRERYYKAGAGNRVKQEMVRGSAALWRSVG